MTLINEVKKALCRTGIEMDARDIADHLFRLPRHAIHVTPAQVSHALHALTITDGDVIRTSNDQNLMSPERQRSRHGRLIRTRDW